MKTNTMLRIVFFSLVLGAGLSLSTAVQAQVVAAVSYTHLTLPTKRIV